MIKRQVKFSNWQLFRLRPAAFSTKWRRWNIFVIPPRRTAAGRPTVGLVMQPVRSSTRQNSGAQAVNAERHVKPEEKEERRLETIIEKKKRVVNVEYLFPGY